MTEQPVRVLVADDHPAFRAGLGLMLSVAPEIEVVGEAADGAAVVDLALRERPDVVLMDIRMPGLDGIEATRRLTREMPDVAVVVLTMFEDDDFVFAAMRAGARGYLLKGADEDELARSIRSVAAGQAIFGPGVAARVLAHFSATDTPARTAFPTLTERETEILQLIAAGKGNAAIAHDLVLTLKTVRNHVSNIFGKLQVADRAAAIVLARESGFGVRNRAAADGRRPPTT